MSEYKYLLPYSGGDQDWRDKVRVAFADLNAHLTVLESRFDHFKPMLSCEPGSLEMVVASLECNLDDQGTWVEEQNKRLTVLESQGKQEDLPHLSDFRGCMSIDAAPPSASAPHLGCDLCGLAIDSNKCRMFRVTDESWVAVCEACLDTIWAYKPGTESPVKLSQFHGVMKDDPKPAPAPTPTQEPTSETLYTLDYKCGDYPRATLAQVRAEFERLFPDEVKRGKLSEAFLHAALAFYDKDEECCYKAQSYALTEAADKLSTLKQPPTFRIAELRRMAAVLSAAHDQAAKGKEEV